MHPVFDGFMKKVNPVNMDTIDLELIREFYFWRSVMNFTLEFAVLTLLLISAFSIYIHFIHVSKDVKEMCKNIVFLKKRYFFESIYSVSYFLVQNSNVRYELYNYITEKNLKVYKNNKLFFSESPYDKGYHFSLTYAEIKFIKNALRMALERQNKE